eukprot:gene8762-710_t
MEIETKRLQKVVDYYLKRDVKSFSSVCSKQIEYLPSEKEKDTVARFSLKVDESMTNMMKKLHGGAAATIVDVITTLVLISVDLKQRPSVSIELNVSYIGSISLNETVIIEVQILKIGANLGFTNCTFKSKEGNILLEGKHTKFMLKSNL